MSGTEDGEIAARPVCCESNLGDTLCSVPRTELSGSVYTLSGRQNTKACTFPEIRHLIFVYS